MAAIQPLLRRLNATLVATEEMSVDDVPLSWEGQVVAGVRLPQAGETASDLVGLLARVEAELGEPLAALNRAGKQRAVRLLEERGAFSYRKAVETVAEALGVTRFTVYNYLNRTRG